MQTESRKQQAALTGFVYVSLCDLLHERDFLCVLMHKWSPRSVGPYPHRPQISNSDEIVLCARKEMYGVPYSSDEAESVVDSEQDPGVRGQKDHSRRRIRKGSTKAYARWWTPHNQQGARGLGNQIPPEGVQEAYGDSRSTANSQDDDFAYTPRRLHWVAAWFPWLWWPSSPPQLPQRDGSSSADDSDVSFREPLGPSMSSTRSSPYEPAHLAETAPRLSFFEQLHGATRSVLHEFNRFAESSLPLLAAVFFLVYLVQFGVISYLGTPSYYRGLNESSALCDFGLTSPFLSFCHTSNVTVDSPAVGIFVDVQLMTEDWISSLEAADQTMGMPAGALHASHQIFEFRKALWLSNLMSIDIFDQRIADYVDNSEANQFSCWKYNSHRLGFFDTLWIELFAFGQRLKHIKERNADRWSLIILIIDTIRFLFPKVSHPGASVIVNASIDYLSVLSDRIETHLLPQGQELRRNFTRVGEDLQKIENICQNWLDHANSRSHARWEKKIWRYVIADYGENTDWLIPQKLSLTLYEPYRQDCVAQIDELLDIYRKIVENIEDLIKRLRAPGAMKGIDQAHLESLDRNIDTLLIRLKFVKVEGSAITGAMFEEDLTSSGAYPKTTPNSEEALSSNEASSEASHNGEEDLTSRAKPKASRSADFLHVS